MIGKIKYIFHFFLIWILFSFFSDCSPRNRGIAPNFVLPLLNEKTISLAQFKGKKIVLLNFWATWCSSCKTEIPVLNALYDKYKKSGLEIIGIAIDKDKNQLKSFVKNQAIHYPIAMGNQKIQSLYKVTGVPEFFLINRAGVILDIFIGPPPARDLEKAIAKNIQVGL